MKVDVIVLGAGVVGSAIAYGLASRNVRVLVLDGGDSDLRAANANFGLVWLQGKGTNMPAYQQLTRDSVHLWPEFSTELTDATAIDLQYERNGGLTICLGEAEYERRRGDLQRLHDQLGGGAEPDWQMFDRDALVKLLPKVQLGTEVAGASFGRSDGHANPLRLLAALHAGSCARAADCSGTVPCMRYKRTAKASRSIWGPSRYRRHVFVIAAGLGSKALAAQVGLDIPFRPQRGQILVTERLEPFLPLPTSGLRQTREGTVMIGATQDEVGFDTSTTTERSAALSAKAIRRIPALSDVRLVRQWAGLRIMHARSSSDLCRIRRPIPAPSWRYAIRALRSPPCTRLCSPTRSPPVGCRPPSMPFTKGASMFRKLHEPQRGSHDRYRRRTGRGRARRKCRCRVAAAGRTWSRLTPVTQSKRAPYCMMGVCFDCLAEVDGVASVQTCLSRCVTACASARQIGKRRISTMNRFDLLIVGAGPAGMAAAVAARRLGLEVMVVDEQPDAGGPDLALGRSGRPTRRYPWAEPMSRVARLSRRSVPVAPSTSLAPNSGRSNLVSRVREPKDGRRRSSTPRLSFWPPARRNGQSVSGLDLAGRTDSRRRANSFQERRADSAGPVWIAGSGPLPLLYAVQLLRAGGQIAGYLDTTPSDSGSRASPFARRPSCVQRSLRGSAGWRSSKGARRLSSRASSTSKRSGNERIEAIRYRTGKGGATRTWRPTRCLVHEGIVPNIHAALRWTARRRGILLRIALRRLSIAGARARTRICSSPVTAPVSQGPKRRNCAASSPRSGSL